MIQYVEEIIIQKVYQSKWKILRLNHMDGMIAYHRQQYQLYQ